MNILNVLADFQEGGGFLPAVLPLAKSLEQDGHSVEIIATDSRINNNCSQIMTFPVTWPLSWLRAPLMGKWLSENIGRFDIVHIHGLWSYPQFMAAKYATFNKIPYIITPHGVFVEPNRYGGIKKTVYLNLLGEKILSNAQTIHVTSALELKGCKQANINNFIKLIPWGLNFNELNVDSVLNANTIWPQLDGRRVMLFMSRLSPEKGLDNLLEALNNVRRVHKDILLVIAGADSTKYNYKKQLDNYIDKHALSRHVMFTGLVQGAEKLALLRRAEVFVMPSYGENFSFSIAEALACGVPVITTTKTPWSEIRDLFAGCYIEPKADVLADAIEKLFSLSLDELHAAGKRGKKLIDEQYDWSVISRKFDELYTSVIDNNRASI